MRGISSISYEDAFSVIEPQIAEGVHVYPFDDECPLDVRFLRFGRKRDIRLNRHEYFELLFAHSGEVVYQVQDRSFHMDPGDLFVMGSSLWHRMSDYPRGSVKAAVLYFLPELVQTSAAPGEALELLRPFIVQDDGFPHIIPAATGIPRQTFGLMRSIASELPASTPPSRLIARTYLHTVLALVARHYASYRGSDKAHQRRQHDLSRLRPLFTFIDANYSTPLSLARAAALLHLSRSSFMRLFRQVTGDSFVSYLNRFRVAKAEELLANTDKPIAEIGQEVGFYDQSYFGATFRVLHKLTPREYRRRMQNDRGSRERPTSAD